MRDFSPQILMDRRQFLGWTAFGLTGASVVGIGSMLNKPKEKHTEHHDTTARKEQLLALYRDQLETVLGIRKQPLSADERKLLFNADSPLDMGCVDEREEVPRGHNKISIAGIGAKMSKAQELDFIGNAKADKSFGPRIQYSVGHEGCAAHGGDDKKALDAATKMARHFNLPGSRVKMAKFGAPSGFRMLGSTPDDRHIHPGMMGVLDTGADFMEGNLGTVIGDRNEKLEDLPDGQLPTFEIYAGKNMPKQYVGTQVDIMRAVFEGKEGMAQVSSAPFIILVTGTRKEIDRVLSEQEAVMKTFAKRPEIVEIVS